MSAGASLTLLPLQLAALLLTGHELCMLLLLLAGMMNAVSGDKAPDKTQGELTGLLKAMGYTQEQVYKF
jgi:cytochrome-b5 reductase